MPFVKSAKEDSLAEQKENLTADLEQAQSITMPKQIPLNRIYTNVRCIIVYLEHELHDAKALSSETSLNFCSSQKHCFT